MSPPISTRAEELLGQVHWIHQLSRALIADHARAEDLAQDALLAACSAARGDERGDSRRWLGGVLRNLRRATGRAEARRRAREVVAARTEALDPTDDLVARADLQRRVVEAVLALEEPYRGTVLLRWFEDQPPRRIAEIQGVGVATVHSRLQRALAMLRARLERDVGGAWSLVLLPCALRVEPAAATVLGVLLMNAKMVLAALAMLIAGTWWYVASDRTSEPLVNGAPAAVERELTAAPPSTHDVPDGAGERERVASEPVEPAAVAPASPEVAQPALATWTVRARVLDADARPIVGLSVRVDGEPATLTTERDGVLSFATRVDRGRLVVADERWVTVRAGLWSRGSSYEPILIAAPSVAIAGVVRDAAGDPLEHARIELLPPDDLASRFETILEATEQRAWLATSDRDGRFELAGVPSIAGARLRAALEGYQTAFAPAPTQDDGHIDFELARPAVELEGRVAGKVIDANGEPIEGARVALGLASTLTDADGGFAIDLDRAVTADAIVAVREGFQPAREERPSDGRWPELVVLRLGEPALSISGRVIDADRKPVAGAKLWISDPTPFGVIGVLPASLENLMAGAAVPPQALEAPNPPRDGNGFWDWYMRAGPPSAVWNWVATDADGRFELSGLADRDYRFQVLIQKPLYIHATGAVRAGDRDVTIQLDAPKLHAKLAGRVVDARGRPVADVRVRCRHNVADVRGRIFGGRTQLVAYEPGASATSDADGRFELVDVPRHGVEIDFSQEEIVPHKVLLDPAHEGELVVRVHVRCHLQVELDEPTDRADEIAFADEDGEGLDVLIIAGGSINAFTSVDLSNGRSEVVSVSSQARTLLLLKGGEVVQRVAIDLVPGEINRLRL